MEKLKRNDQSVLSEIRSDYRDALVEDNVLIEDQSDLENNLFLDNLSQRMNKEILGLTIIPTMSCNFECIYCYEKDRPNIFMNDKTVKSILNFVKKFDKIRSIHVQWYGGEPLLAYNIIQEITTKILNFRPVKQKKISYSADIITNAYLLNETIVNSLSDLKIQKMQVTIDGTEQIHNSRRPHVSNPDSYQTIIKNLHYLFEQFPDFIVDIRVNIDERNKDSFSKLVKELYLLFPMAKNMRIYPGIVQDMNSCNKGSDCFFDIKRQADFRLEQYIKHGLNLGYYPETRTNICLAQHINSFVIDSEGNVVKCWLDIGNKDRVVGNVNKKGISNEILLGRYLAGCNPFNDSKCMNCSIFPICGGGCQHSLITNKYEHKTHKVCSIFKTHLKEYLLTHKNIKEKNTPHDHEKNDN